MISKLTLVWMTLIVVTSSQLTYKNDPSWSSWLKQFGRTFANAADESGAYANFKANDLFITQHNSGNHKYKLAHNAYSHMVYTT